MTTTRRDTASVGTAFVDNTPAANAPDDNAPDDNAPADGSCAVDDSCIGSHRRPAGTRAAVGLIHVYQLARTGRTSPCRFVPTCSEFAVTAVERHGLRHGLRLTLGRLGRCRPGGPFGSDPVPE